MKLRFKLLLTVLLKQHAYYRLNVAEFLQELMNWCQGCNKTLCLEEHRATKPSVLKEVVAAPLRFSELMPTFAFYYRAGLSVYN